MFPLVVDQTPDCCFGCLPQSRWWNSPLTNCNESGICPDHTLFNLSNTLSKVFLTMKCVHSRVKGLASLTTDRSTGKTKPPITHPSPANTESQLRTPGEPGRAGIGVPLSGVGRPRLLTLSGRASSWRRWRGRGWNASSGDGSADKTVEKLKASAPQRRGENNTRTTPSSS